MLEVLNNLDTPTGSLRSHDQLVMLSRQTSHEIMALRPTCTEAPTAVRDAVDRGVVVRDVVPDRVRTDPIAIASMDRYASFGAKIRTVAAVPGRLFVFDRSTAVIPLGDGVGPGVVLTDAGSLALLCALFERVWADGHPYSHPFDSDGLTGQQFATLRLLADGHTDDAIAKRLGVSARTVRRIATALMSRLGARGRFQAGVHAVQAGWLAMPTTTSAPTRMLAGADVDVSRIDRVSRVS